MAFVTGLLLIDAPASALNNQGNIPGARTENTVGVKSIRVKGEGAYPYVSAQSFRYWLRSTLEKGDFDWQSAPTFREKKIAYTDANPIKWWDDDLLGYMRAPSTKSSAQEAREATEDFAALTPITDTVTRVSPLRVSTLVSIAPVEITDDFGTMTRHEGDPVPHEHQFYRTTLKGMFSLDLHACGTFSYRQKTGYRNLDDNRLKEAEEKNLEPLPDEKSYRLPITERLQRITTLFEGFAQLEGGAKQTIHYTDVSPVITIFAVTQGGNNIFGHVTAPKSTSYGKTVTPTINIEALQEALTVFTAEILSPVYVGWVKGYQDEERAKLEAALAEGGALAPFADKIQISHPREAFKALIEAMNEAKNSGWLD
ncbi:MAG: type I-B CRISPR-associated protein Cas7/Cst2/DevR [Anaerolineales bacterium]|nr:type I-B CRISPR-associated protein Cas7/Cst2/DevR [Anaerolineales bacterium]